MLSVCRVAHANTPDNAEIVATVWTISDDLRSGGPNLLPCEGKLKLMADAEIQFVSNESGEPTAVIIPIALWREIESERETAYLLKSETMKRRLLSAKDHHEGLSLEVAIEKLGI
jgi:antitoxin YefM